MTWFGWALVAFCVFSGATSAMEVGHPREPLSPAGAALTWVTCAAIIVGTLTVGTGHGR